MKNDVEKENWKIFQESLVSADINYGIVVASAERLRNTARNLARQIYHAAPFKKEGEKNA